MRHTTEGIRVLEVDDVEPTDGLVRVRIGAGGICGSDLHLIGWGPLPVTLGHEFAGRLDDGTPVAVAPATPCGRCDRCIAGEVHLCSTLMGRTHGVAIDGGLADAVLVEPAALTALPTGVALADAALVEPLAVAVHGLHRAAATPGQRVAVIGGGSIGLATVAVAARMGLEPELAARHPHQRAAGERLGARPVEGTGHDVVVDAAGTQSAVDEAFDLVRPGGTVLAVATYWAPVRVGLAMTVKEVRFVAATCYGTHGGRREFDEAVAVLAASPDLASALITHRFALDDAAQAFAGRRRPVGRRHQGGARTLRRSPGPPHP